MTFGLTRQTRRWHEIDYSNQSTFPHHGRPVLCCDQIGRMAVCWFDAMSHDFLLDSSAFNSGELANIGEEIIRGALDDVGVVIDFNDEEKNKAVSDYIEKSLFETAASGRINSVAYFNACYWMALPLPPVDIGDENNNGADEVEYLTYDIVDEIAHSVRKVINQRLKECNS